MVGARYGPYGCTAVRVPLNEELTESQRRSGMCSRLGRRLLHHWQDQPRGLRCRVMNGVLG